ncbi:SMP-30/gluconolactonase/LRE family protein [Emticicia sp. TH156]|uniref:SMP-30/gluconolactonase/LRE family protein n=1 Tax=Emticicia sp. TH156 TaxID=2067454 RepID=UPI000C7692E1|nr:SMP-30/gluconolactonase/LRE family protein [Emticicia sp. TH156]PLK45365.1 hypothetical protein C0V77_04270 [Emticicia sp. TH156]
MKRFIKIIFAFVLIITAFVLKTLWNAGTFTKIEPHFDGKIKELPGFNGAEDITIDKTTGLAFVSSGGFIANAPNGNIFLIDCTQKAPKPVNLTAPLTLTDFHPHGISLFQSPEGEKRLFVVNHKKNRTSIEIFSFQDSILTHLETINSNLFASPNDLVAVGERQFYFTNDHDEEISEWRSKKDLLQIPMGNVGYFDGSKVKIMADGFLYANGINVSNDGQKLYVAATSGRKIVVFDRDILTGNIKESSEIAINGADNIEIDESGDLWVGCHPKLLAFLAHAKDHSKLSPSEVISVSLKTGAPAIKSIYLNDGTQLSGSSVGAVWRNKLLIGSVFGDKVLLCTMKQ